MRSGDSAEGGDERRTSLADERTTLAAERTLLAWWRTGMAALAVALGVGRVLPVLAPNATRWPYVVLGSGFALYGIAMFLLGTRRLAFERSQDTTLFVFMATGVLLGLGTLAVIVAQ